MNQSRVNEILALKAQVEALKEIKEIRKNYCTNVDSSKMCDEDM